MQREYDIFNISIGGKKIGRIEVTACSYDAELASKAREVMETLRKGGLKFNKSHTHDIEEIGRIESYMLDNEKTYYKGEDASGKKFTLRRLK